MKTDDTGVTTAVFSDGAPVTSKGFFMDKEMGARSIDGALHGVTYARNVCSVGQTAEATS